MKFTFGIFTLFILCAAAASAQNKVSIQEQNGSYQLSVNGKPFYVKGFVGGNPSYSPDFIAGKQFDIAQKSGANAVRTSAVRVSLDSAAKYGFKALADLPIYGERDGMDWNDETRKAELKAKVLGIVSDLKNHPALLVWALGNELDWIPPGKPYNSKLWTFFNDLAKEIHRIDPNHPVMTIVGFSDVPKKLDELAVQCPDLDLLGINAYADLAEFSEAVIKHWKRPYLVTEWGPDGHWEVPKTTFKVALEQSSTEKAEVYRDRYKNAILKNRAFCLGSFVFYWHSKQEITHTWYGMFDEKGSATETVEAMQLSWSGKYPANRSPKILNYGIENKTDKKTVILQKGQTFGVIFETKDPENETVQLSYEIRPEAVYASYAGQGEQAAPIVANGPLNTQKTELKAPAEPGKYRIFLRADDAHGHHAIANIPFLVED
jgi:Glycosyl hydrolases family 2, TIM barrel domain